MGLEECLWRAKKVRNRIRMRIQFAAYVRDERNPKVSRHYFRMLPDTAICFSVPTADEARDIMAFVAEKLKERLSDGTFEN